MEIDIYCKDGKCPICSRQMRIEYCDTFMGNDYYCDNKCYQIEIYSRDDVQFDMKVFGEYFETGDDFPGEIDKVIERIKHWKENDRYLIELLERR